MEAVVVLPGIALVTVVTAFVLLIAVGGWVLVRRARRGRTGSESPAMVGAELLRADEALRDAEDELGFAFAQFGDAATVELRSAIETGRRELRHAFELQQRLEDPSADTRSRRGWQREILAVAERTRARVASELQRLAEQRNDEVHAPVAAAALRERLARSGDELAAATAVLEGLRVEYAPSLIEPLLPHPAGARAALDAAVSELDTVEAELAERTVTAVGGRLRTAREQVGRAAALMTAIESRRRELAAADEAVATLRDQSRTALEAARLERDSAPDADSAARVSGALSDLAAVLAHDSDAARGRDPIQELDRLVTAADRLEAAIAASRNQQRRLDGARAALDGALVSAHAQIAAVEDLIRTGRGGVGVDARTRLAEAERQLFLAEHEADPVAALDAARRAQTHARDADALARYRIGGSAPLRRQ